ncbi:MAG TPA: hypothetical protein VJ179_01310 [Patescibacteria group bacterium]|nr:hypothetical protein [Patescibacteria group bacterium]
MTRDQWLRLKPLVEFIVSFTGALLFTKQLISQISQKGADQTSLMYLILIIGSLLFFGYSLGRAGGIRHLFFHIGIALLVINGASFLYFVNRFLQTPRISNLFDMLSFSIGFVLRFAFVVASISLLRSRTGTSV